MTEEKLYQVALSLAPGTGNMLTKQLISYLGSPKEILKTPMAGLLKIPGIGPKTANGLKSNELLKKAEKIITDCEREEVSLLYFQDEAYPSKLKVLDDSPCILYKKGALELNATEKNIAIVGTREATRYGKKITEQILEDLQPLGINIISGLAYGIDVIAHKKCLELEIPTVGVMANGIDSVYPREHKEVAFNMLKQGALLTENPPGSRPDAPKFPARNRIIAGMSDVTIVVEGATKGGALITADIANSYNREVFAVPGNIDAKYSQGCNKLIRYHEAHIYTGLQDLTSIMNWGEYESKSKTKVKPTNLPPNEEKAYDFLVQANKSCTLDEISRLTQISVLELLPVLLNLEFANHIKTVPGNEYEIT